MSNQLVYNGVTFNDAYIVGGNIIRSKSPITDELSYDELDIRVTNELKKVVDDQLYDSESSELTDSTNENLYARMEVDPILPFVRGTAGDLYHNNTFIGKFYIESVDRINRNVFELHFVSALGILDRRIYKGDVYNTKPAKEIIADIFDATLASEDTDYEYYTGDIPFYIAKNVGNLPMTGWLPYNESSRISLQQILFALGASALKTSDGTLKFAFWQPTEAITIDDDRLYIGGKVNYKSKATRVVVIEHEFRITSLDKQVELFYSNSVTVEHKTIVFNKPMHTFSTTGSLTIDTVGGTQQCGANYAVVSGSGKLLGYEYTHNQTTFTKETGIVGDDKTVNVSNAYLVSALNSYNVAERVAAYYGYADEVVYDFVVEGDVLTGDRVKFTDPFGEEITAYLSSEDITISSALKATAKFITNWQPNHVGNTFNNYTILSEGTTWEVPQSLQGKPARVIVFGGFEGGRGGYNGAAGEQKSHWDKITDSDGTYVPASAGGNGGNGGNGGTTVHMNIMNIQSLAATYNYTLGNGGNGGSSNGGAGSLGADSTFENITTNPSSGGVVNTEGYANPITGEIYGGRAESGTKGGKGGASGRNGYGNGAYIIGTAERGENVGTHNGGNVGGQFVVIIQGTEYHSSPSGGGGATTQANGGSGWTESYKTVGGYWVYLSRGGNGASCSTAPEQAALGKNGRGGDGGGGGGGVATMNCRGSNWWTGGRSSGGTGQKGQQGSNGFILILHE